MGDCCGFFLLLFLKRSPIHGHFDKSVALYDNILHFLIDYVFVNATVQFLLEHRKRRDHIVLAASHEWLNHIHSIETKDERTQASGSGAR